MISKELKEQIKKDSPNLYKKIKGPLNNLAKISSLEEAGEVASAITAINETNTEDLDHVIQQLEEKAATLEDTNKEEKRQKKDLEKLKKRVDSRRKEITKKHEERNKLQERIEKSDKFDPVSSIGDLFNSLGLGGVSTSLSLAGGAIGKGADATKKGIQGLRKLRVEKLDQELAQGSKSGLVREPSQEPDMTQADEPSVAQQGIDQTSSQPSMMGGNGVLERIRMNTENTVELLFEVEDAIQKQSNLVKENHEDQVGTTGSSRLQMLEQEQEESLLGGDESETEEEEEKSDLMSILPMFFLGRFLTPLRGMFSSVLSLGLKGVLLSPILGITTAITKMSGALLRPIKGILGGVSKLGPKLVSGFSKLKTAFVTGMTSLGRSVQMLATSRGGRMAGRGLGIGLAGTAGYGVGSMINDKFIEGTKFQDLMGKGLVGTMAMLGHDESIKTLKRQQEANKVIEDNSPASQSSTGNVGKAPDEKSQKANNAMKKLSSTKLDRQAAEDFVEKHYSFSLDEKEKLAASTGENPKQAREDLKNKYVNMLMKEDTDELFQDAKALERVSKFFNSNSLVGHLEKSINDRLEAVTSSAAFKYGLPQQEADRIAKGVATEVSPEMEVKSKKLQETTENRIRQEKENMARETGKVLLNSPSVNAPQTTNNNTTVVHAPDKDPSIRKSEMRNMEGSMY